MLYTISLSLYIYMYIYIYTSSLFLSLSLYIYIYIYTHIYTYTHICEPAEATADLLVKGHWSVKPKPKKAPISFSDASVSVALAR